MSRFLATAMLMAVLPGCGSGLPGHVSESVEPRYDSDPPTGGKHYSRPAAPGFYTTPQRYGHLVHFLEHGGVVLYYDPARLTSDEIQTLRTIVGSYPFAFGGLIGTPRPDPAHVVIATAWGQILRMETFDVSQIQLFISAHRDKGPESRGNVQ